ncbi:MAG: FAD/NAD(P)-binding protein [Nitrospirota bacterium]
MKNLLLPDKAVIRDIRRETGDVRTYTLSLEGDSLHALPGQFNMLGWPGVGEAPISVSSLHGPEGIQHTIRAVGRVTNFLASMAEGDEIFIRGAYGSPWPLRNAEDMELVLVAGGLGMAPLRPVVQSIVRGEHRPGDVTLVYGARDPLSMLFRDELDGWRRHFRLHLTVDEVPEGVPWDGGVGLVTEYMEDVAQRPSQAVAFLCGPEIMMRFAARKLLMKGMPPGQIYVSMERRLKCGIAQCGHCQHGSAFVCKDGPVFRYGDVGRFPDGLL